MERLVRARVLVAEAESLGLTINDLVAAADDRPRRVSNGVPTVAEYVEVVERAFGPGRTAETYRSYWRLAVARFGDRLIDAVSDEDCEQVVADAVARAQRQRPGSDGRSSREHCVTALRALFRRAERARLIARDPTAVLDKPRRLESRRRALDDAELAEAVEAVRTTSHDPDLDLLLVRSTWSPAHGGKATSSYGWGTSTAGGQLRGCARSTASCVSSRFRRHCWQR